MMVRVHTLSHALQQLLTLKAFHLVAYQWELVLVDGHLQLSLETVGDSQEIQAITPLQMEEHQEHTLGLTFLVLMQERF